MLILCAILFWILNMFYGYKLALKIEKLFDEIEVILYDVLPIFISTCSWTLQW